MEVLAHTHLASGEITTAGKNGHITSGSFNVITYLWQKRRSLDSIF